VGGDLKSNKTKKTKMNPHADAASKEMEDCTHKVDGNYKGYVALHCFDNQPLSQEALKAIIDGPLASKRKKLDRFIAENQRPQVSR
jgi:hypothetical protein